MPKKGSKDGEDFFSSGINRGIQKITSRHPKFRGMEKYIAERLDTYALKDNVQKEYDVLLKSGCPKEKIPGYLEARVAEYVAEGTYFDDQGKEIILKKGLEERATRKGVTHYFSRRSAKKELKGEEELDLAIGSFKDLYTAFQSGDYAERMPDLAIDVQNIYDLGFFDVAVDILHQGGLLDDKKYAFMRKTIKGKIQEGSRRVTAGIEQAVMPQRAAAVILALLGIAMLAFFGFTLTGNVTADNSVSSTGNFFGLGAGLVFLVLSFMISARLRAIKKKKNSKKVKKRKKR